MGKILIIKGADFSKVAIGAQPIPPTPPTPTGNLWDEALKDTDIAPLMANSTKVYELASAISNDGTKVGTPVNTPGTVTLSNSYFILFDATFNSAEDRLTPAIITRLADNGNFVKFGKDNYYSFSAAWTSDKKVMITDLVIGNRYKFFAMFDRRAGTLIVKNLTTGKLYPTLTGVTGGGTLREQFYLAGGASEINAFNGTIHKFYIGVK